MEGAPQSKPYLSSSQIDELTSSLASRINADYKEILKSQERLVVVVTLKGAAIFAADLVRKLNVPLTIEFIRATSYGAGTSSSGNVRILQDVEITMKGAHVLVLDEIIDSGFTLKFLSQMFKNREPASLKICALLSKPSRREVEVPVDYIGIDVEDKFLIGYGLDFNEKYRNLKDIHVLDSGA